MSPSSSIANAAVPLTSYALKTFQIAKVFKETDDPKQITSIDFDSSGEYCVTSSEDESLRMYDCVGGKLHKTVFSKKYGCNFARFTHRYSNVIFASTKIDDTIRYLSFHDNKFIRYFKGHTQKVVSLEMSPQDDSFLSASQDGTVRLWDLRSPSAEAILQIGSAGQPSVAFDQGGLIFGVGLNSNSLRLYDVKNFNQGPFSTFSIDTKSIGKYELWHSINFSNDGRHVLVSTTGAHLYLIDAFNGAIKHVLSGNLNIGKRPFHATFTPDGKFVVCGSPNGRIHFWEVDSGRKVGALDGPCKPNMAVKFNPKYMMIASADTELAFWTQPYEDEE